MQSVERALLLALAGGVLALLRQVDGSRAQEARDALADALDDAHTAGETLPT